MMLELPIEREKIKQDVFDAIHTKGQIVPSADIQIADGNSLLSIRIHAGARVIVELRDRLELEVQSVLKGPSDFDGFIIGRIVDEEILVEIPWKEIKHKLGTRDSLIIPDRLFVFNPGNEIEATMGTDSSGRSHSLVNGTRVSVAAPKPSIVQFVKIAHIFNSNWIKTQCGFWFHSSLSPWMLDISH